LAYAVFSHDEQGLRVRAGVSLPAFWHDQYLLAKVGTTAGGIASFEEKSLERIPENGAYWNILSALAQSAGFEVCWSEPIVSSGHAVDETLVSFRKHIGNSALPDLAHQQQAANLMSIAIQSKRAQEQLLLAHSVYESSSEAIMVVDSENRIVAVNPAFEHITGYKAQEAIGRDPNLLQSERQAASFYQEMWLSIMQDGAWRGELWNRRKNGELYPQSMSINTILDEDGRVLRRIAVFSDITDKKQAEEQIHHLAHHDLLTDLPNRVLYADRLAQALATARRDQSRVGLLYVDLDNFKPVNDGYGHAVGDQLLRNVAQRLLSCVRETDTVARIGGDKFVVLLPTIQSESNAQVVAEKIRASLEAPFEIDGNRLSISSSIGGAIYPNHGEDESQLMQHADHAMYGAKKSGRNMVRFAEADRQYG
jgi:diguanylate cyclase (GGDEF)-like protein/PAS domain S-box-containing protein